MPPKNPRKTSSTTPRGAQTTQGTLAFGTQNKITKPNSAATTKSSSGKTNTRSKSKSKSKSKPLSPAVLATTTTTTAILHENDADAETIPTPKPKPKPRTKPILPDNDRSSDPTPPQNAPAAATASQISNYWAHKQSTRLHPRLHQQTLTVHEKILREFDLSSTYGPCIGITRLKRWKRAEGMGLAPPAEVLAVILREQVEAGREGGGGAAMEALLG